MSLKASQGISELNKNRVIDRVSLDFPSYISAQENLGNMIFLGFTQGGPWIKSLFRDDCACPGLLVGSAPAVFTLLKPRTCIVHFLWSLLAMLIFLHF